MQQDAAREAVNYLAREAHTTALEKGFWEPPHPFIGEINTKLLLITSEVAEAQDTLRQSYEGVINPYSQMTDEQASDFVEEIADIIIRAFDLAEYFQGVTGHIGDTVVAKMDRNANRPHKHSKRF